MKAHACYWPFYRSWKRHRWMHARLHTHTGHLTCPGAVTSIMMLWCMVQSVILTETSAAGRSAGVLVMASTRCPSTSNSCDRHRLTISYAASQGISWSQSDTRLFALLLLWFYSQHQVRGMCTLRTLLCSLLCICCWM